MRLRSAFPVAIAILACVVSAAAGTRAFRLASADLAVPVTLWCLTPDGASCPASLITSADEVFERNGTGLRLRLVNRPRLPAAAIPRDGIADCDALQAMLLASPEGALHREGTLNVYVAEIEQVLGRTCDAESILLHARSGAATLAHEVGHVFGLRHAEPANRGGCGGNLMCANAYGTGIDAVQALRIRQSCQYRRLRASAEGARTLPSCTGNLSASVRVMRGSPRPQAR